MTRRRIVAALAGLGLAVGAALAAPLLGGSGGGAPTAVPPTATATAPVRVTPAVSIGSAVIVRCQVRGALPDPACTPGVINPNVTQANLRETICSSGWTATVRPPASYTNDLKVRQMEQYSLPGPTTLYEEDHRIPLEVGGNPTDAHNLWPQPWDGPQGAHAKDLVENEVRRRVCAGSMTLAQGQAVFLGDWTAFR